MRLLALTAACFVGLGLVGGAPAAGAQSVKPTISSVNPKSGSTAGGARVTVVGTNFTSGATVKFGSTAGTAVTVNSSTTLTAIAPAHAAGAVDVRVTTTSGVSAKTAADRYTYLDATPPAPVTGVTANPTSSSVALRWVNPTSSDFAGVTIRRAVGTSPPPSPTAGTSVAATSGSVTAVTDAGLTAGTTYTYALFARDAVPNFATAATITISTVAAGLCTDSWTGGARSSAWSNPGNWSTGAAPTTSDWVCIAAGQPLLPVQVTSAQVAGISNDGGLVVRKALTLTDTSASSSSSGSLALSGALTVADGLYLHGRTSITGALRIDGHVANESTGTITVSAAASMFLASGSTFYNGGTMSFGAGSTVDAGCATPAAGSQPATNAGSVANVGSLVAAGTSTSPVTLGKGDCLETDNYRSLQVVSGQAVLGGSSFSMLPDATVTGSAASSISVKGAVQSYVADWGGVGHVDITGRLIVAQSLDLNAVSVSGATIELWTRANLTAQSADLNGGTLQLDADSGNPAGQFIVQGSVNPSSMTVQLDYSQLTPDCGTHVVALTASTVSATFGAVVGPPLPDGSVWAVEQTASSAGAFVYCGAPRGDFTFTFNSPTRPWTADELATLQSWTRPDSPVLAAVYAVAGHPIRDITLNVNNISGTGFGGDYDVSRHAVELADVRLDVFVHELNHAVHDLWGLDNQVWEEGMARGAEDEELRILAAQGINSVVILGGDPVPTGDPYHGYIDDVYYDLLNTPDLGPEHGKIYSYSEPIASGLLRYEEGGYAFGKMFIEHPDFLTAFNAKLFLQPPYASPPMDVLLGILGSIVTTVEGQPFATWYAAQGIFTYEHPAGCYVYQRIDDFYALFYCRDSDGMVTIQSAATVTYRVYGADGSVLYSGQASTNDNGVADFGDQVNSLFSSYVGRIMVVASATSSAGSASSTSYRTIDPGPDDGVFGLITNQNSGSVTFRSPTGSFATVTASVVNGRFAAASLNDVRGQIVATFTAPGMTATKTFTKAESAYAIRLTAHSG